MHLHSDIAFQYSLFLYYFTIYLKQLYDKNTLFNSIILTKLFVQRMKKFSYCFPTLLIKLLYTSADIGYEYVFAMHINGINNLS